MGLRKDSYPRHGGRFAMWPWRGPQWSWRGSPRTVPSFSEVEKIHLWQYYMWYSSFWEQTLANELNPNITEYRYDSHGRGVVWGEVRSRVGQIFWRKVCLLANFASQSAQTHVRLSWQILISAAASKVCWSKEGCLFFAKRMIVVP